MFLGCGEGGSSAVHVPERVSLGLDRQRREQDILRMRTRGRPLLVNAVSGSVGAGMWEDECGTAVSHPSATENHSNVCSMPGKKRAFSSYI